MGSCIWLWVVVGGCGWLFVVAYLSITRTQACKEIFTSALVHINAFLGENNSRTLTGNIEQIKSFVNKLCVNKNY